MSFLSWWLLSGLVGTMIIEITSWICPSVKGQRTTLKKLREYSLAEFMALALILFFSIGAGMLTLLVGVIIFIVFGYESLNASEKIKNILEWKPFSKGDDSGKK